MVKQSSRQLVPVIGVWYHVDDEKQPGMNHRAYCLCVNVSEEEGETIVSLCYRENDCIVNKCFNSKVLRESVWLKTNEFHVFCLRKLYDMLQFHPTQNELKDNLLFQLCLDFATQFRVFRAKNVNKAIDRAYDTIGNMEKDRRIERCFIKDCSNCVNLLVKEYYDSCHAWLK